MATLSPLVLRRLHSLLHHGQGATVWMSSAKVGVLCSLCASVQENHLLPSLEGNGVPKAVQAQCRNGSFLLEITFPASGIVYNWAKGRIEAAEPRMATWGDESEDETANESASMIRDPYLPVYGDAFKESIIRGGLASLKYTRLTSTSIEIVAQLAPIKGDKWGRSIAKIRASKCLDSKTVAILYRGLDKPPIIAVSGWNSGLSGCSYVLDQKVWCSEVKKLQVLIGHVGSPNRFPKYPNGEESRCHAEKLAIAFFVMGRLAPSGPQMPPEVWIALNRDACRDCKMFRKRVQRKYKLKINFVLMRNAEVEKKALQAARKKARAKRNKVLSPPNSHKEARDEAQRKEREYTYLQSESSDENYEPDGDDESSSEDETDRANDEADELNDDESEYDESEYDESEYYEEESPSPKGPIDRKSRAMMRYHLSKAEKKYPLEKHASRRYNYPEMSSDSDTDFGRDPITPLAAIRTRRLLFQEHLTPKDGEAPEAGKAPKAGKAPRPRKRLFEDYSTSEAVSSPESIDAIRNRRRFVYDDPSHIEISSDECPSPRSPNPQRNEPKRSDNGTMSPPSDGSAPHTPFAQMGWLGIHNVDRREAEREWEWERRHENDKARRRVDRKSTTKGDILPKSRGWVHCPETIDLTGDSD